MNENEDFEYKVTHFGAICFGPKKWAEFEDIWNRPDSGRARYWRQRARFKIRRRLTHLWTVTSIVGLQPVGDVTLDPPRG